MLWMLLVACAGVEIAPDAVVLFADGEELWRCEGEEEVYVGDHSVRVVCNGTGHASWAHDFGADDWLQVDERARWLTYDSDFTWDEDNRRVTGWAEGEGPPLYLLTFDVVAD